MHIAARPVGPSFEHWPAPPDAAGREFPHWPTPPTTGRKVKTPAELSGLDGLGWLGDLACEGDTCWDAGASLPSNSVSSGSWWQDMLRWGQQTASGILVPRYRVSPGGSLTIGPGGMQQTQQTPGYPVPFFGASVSPGGGTTLLLVGAVVLVAVVVLKGR